MSVLDLPAIEAAFRALQRAFPEINEDLSDRRDPFDDEVVANMLQGYALVDRLLADKIDILAMGRLNCWLKINAVVLCGACETAAEENKRLLQATEQRFYDQEGGGIGDIMEWYSFNLRESVWRRAAGVYNRLLAEPQLFIEGNHRSGALIMSYLLVREGRPPFVLTKENAKGFFDPSSVMKKTKKRSIIGRVKFGELTRAFADFLKAHADPRFLAR